MPRLQAVQRGGRLTGGLRLREHAAPLREQGPEDTGWVLGMVGVGLYQIRRLAAVVQVRAARWTQRSAPSRNCTAPRERKRAERAGFRGHQLRPPPGRHGQEPAPAALGGAGW
ncbi:hypothetical protein H920_16133 [Fukomys damarensis]|uniref:Uncharacterized protein n=1 Tax=Fukomys damarensis TaxID=885580 RepID=A0A091CV73_FUKDA|nr:hypothetical protein H920_16133 [Fukomys damarensis]